MPVQQESAGYIDFRFESMLDGIEENVNTEHITDYMRDRHGLYDAVLHIGLHLPIMKRSYGRDYRNRHERMLMLLAKVESAVPLLPENMQRPMLRLIDNIRTDYRKLFDLPAFAGDQPPFTEN